MWEKDLIFEFIGTAILVLFGGGVTANVNLKNTFGNSSGWIVIAFGWGFAVFVGAFIAAPYSGAHLNPALTVGLAAAGEFHGNVPGYIAAQMLGAMLGAALVYMVYKPHFDAEEDPRRKLVVFSTRPAIKAYFYNFMGEVTGTFALTFGVLLVSGAGMVGPFPVAILIVAIGMSLGGTTGYAINPARDLGPRIMHAILPIKGKGSSNWSYAWIPVLAPLCGSLLAALLYLAVA